MSEKWYAKRNSVSARTDEDAAMASATEGPFASEADAHAALAGMIEREIKAWRAMNMDASRDERALDRVCAGETDVTEGNVRWNLVNATPQPVTEKWQCDLHGVSVAAMCCELARDLGAYTPTERVRCARCEEYVAEPKHEGREFGRASSNGAICMPCAVADEFDGQQRLTVTQADVVAWLINPSKDNARRVRKATRLTYAKLLTLGFIVEINEHPFYAATLMGRKFVQMRVRDLPLMSPAENAARLIERAGGAAAEAAFAEELADAIGRFDRTAQDYFRATLDAVAQIKRIVVAAGGTW